MAEHIEIVLTITGSLFFLIFGLIGWQGNRQIKRIDNMESKLMKVEENTNIMVSDIREDMRKLEIGITTNYVKQFREVNANISDLKESNAIHFGNLSCAIGKIETVLQMTQRHLKENSEIKNKE